jgi:hypothetical protein
MQHRSGLLHLLLGFQKPREIYIVHVVCQKMYLSPDRYYGVVFGSAECVLID